MRSLRLIGLCFFLGTIIQPLKLPAQTNIVLLQSLKGSWQFSIGEREEWISPKYDDNEWESVNVPSSWEDQGFHGYNGYAFYRKKTNISSDNKGRMLYLVLGYIDDVDEVYFNGKMIGSTGSFPPKYSTAYNAQRKYYIPEEYIRFDAPNIIAVKVYDAELAGGIVSGNIGIYGGKIAVDYDVNLQTTWKFKTGDDLKRKEINYDDSDWDKIFVPAKWEDQGYRNYDGAAWYRKSFVLKVNTTSDKMVILLGKIDDIDQVYINGILVGSTGTFYPKPGMGGKEYDAIRGYIIPDGVLKYNQENVISIRVIDFTGAGGIYEGPVGLLTQTKYIQYWRNIRNSK